MDPSGCQGLINQGSTAVHAAVDRVDDTDALLSLLVRAKNVREDETRHASVRRVAKAVLKMDAPPVVVGTAALPLQISGCSLDSTLDSEHARLLSRRFAKKWREHVEVALRSRGSKEYFIPGSAGGGIVLTRYMTLHMGRYVPAVEIESLVATADGRGAGSRLVEFAKDILFHDSPPRCDYGFLFAQAVKTPFWEVCCRCAL